MFIHPPQKKYLYVFIVIHMPNKSNNLALGLLAPAGQSAQRIFQRTTCAVEHPVHRGSSASGGFIPQSELWMNFGKNLRNHQAVQ
jgi:hypothetical protein